MEDDTNKVEYFTDRLNNDKNEIAVCGNKMLHLRKDGSTAILTENEPRKYNKSLQSIYGFRIKNDRIEKTKEENLINMDGSVDRYKNDNTELGEEEKNMNLLWNKNEKKKKEDKSFKGFFEPADHQLAVLKANLDKGVLICHGPGQGKTINAILLAEQKRVESGKENRILIVAPQGQILQQWQETVVEMGINPSHYIFQTLAHFRLSQLERQYPEYKTLTDEVKEFYEKKAWELNSETNKYVLKLPSKEEEGEYIVDENKEIDGVKNNFIPALNDDPSLSTFRKLLKNSVKSSTEDKYYSNLTVGNVEAWYTIDGINTFDATNLKRIQVKDRDKYRYRNFFNTEESIYDTLRAIEPYTFICRKDKKYILFSSVDTDMDPVDMSVDQKRNLLKEFDNNKIRREQTTVKEFNLFLQKEEGVDDIKEFQSKSLPEGEGRIPKMNVYMLNGELRITSVNTLRKEFNNLKINDATTKDDLKEFLNDEFGLKAFVQKRFPKMKPKYNEQKNVKSMKTSIEKVLKTLEKKYKFKKDDPAKMDSKTVAQVKEWIQNDRCILVKGEYFIKENGILTMDDLATIENIAWIERYNYPTIDISDIKNFNDPGTSLKLNVDRVDTFTNLQHGKSLLQHRYIAEPSCILILDEAHACLSIDDKKKNTSTLMDYGKTSTFNILVTATPFLSSNPLKQMLQFAQILNQNSEIEMKDMWKKLKSKISRYNKLSKNDGDIMFQQLKNVGYFENANVPYLPYNGVDTPNEMYESSKDMYNDHKQILLTTINTLDIKNVTTQADYFVEEQKKSSSTLSEKTSDEKLTFYRNAYLEYLKKKIKKFNVREQKMKMFLHDNDVKWNIKSTVFDKNSKSRLLDKAMRSVFPERESTVATNPFPTKLEAVDIEVKYPIETCNVASNTYYKLWDLGLTDVGETTVFEYIETLNGTWRQKYTYLKTFSDTLKQYGKWKNKWIPIVIHVKNDDNEDEESFTRKQKEVLTVLNTIAYVKKQLFVILLWETSDDRECEEDDIKTLLPQIRAYRCRRYDSAKAFRWQRKLEDGNGWERDINYEFLDEELQKKFNEETTPNTSWKQTLQCDDQFLKEAMVPYFHLESKVYEIAYFIEQCVAENKNVIVYDFSIEKLQELEKELLRRQNKKVILDEKECNFTDEDVQTISTYIKKKWKLWINEVEGYNKQDELKFMENTLEEVEKYLGVENHELLKYGNELLRALKKETNEELLRFKYNHIAKLSRKGYYAKAQIEETFKLKEEVYSTDQNGYYTLEDGTKILATMDHIPITEIVYNYSRAKDKKDLLQKKKANLLRGKLDTAIK